MIKKEIEKINKKCGSKNNKYLKELEIIKNYKLQLETKIEVRDGYEKVFKRNKGLNSNSIDNKDDINKDNKNINNINIGININVNHDLKNKEKTKEKNEVKNNNINIINNNNHIFVNNINIINPTNFDYQINPLNKDNQT